MPENRWMGEYIGMVFHFLGLFTPEEETTALSRNVGD
jgi:hypothetical protein